MDYLPFISREMRFSTFLFTKITIFNGKNITLQGVFNFSFMNYYR